MDFLNQSIAFSRGQYKGLLALLGILFVGQVFFFLLMNFTSPEIDYISPAEKKWMEEQIRIDSLKLIAKKNNAVLKPFNPNFISDYKGYVLGMSVAEIDRLHQFRKDDNYVNSIQEFQKVTKVSDQWLSRYSVYFKFPDWVKNKKSKKDYVDFSKKNPSKNVKIVLSDINRASKEDLMKIYGIGNALSDRILKEKEKLGAFVNLKQIDDIWGLSPEVIDNIKKHYKVISTDGLKKIAINRASIKEIQKLPYFTYYLARDVVTFRSMNGEIKSESDLVKIKGFPVEKVDIIALYLDFN